MDWHMRQKYEEAKVANSFAMLKQLADEGDGYVPAANDVGFAHHMPERSTLEGRPSEKSFADAERYYAKAIELGSSAAVYNYASMLYQQGRV